MNLHASLYCLGLRSRKRRFTAACGSLLKVEPTFLCAHRGRAYCPPCELSSIAKPMLGLA